MKCTVVGRRHPISRTVTFPGTEHPPLTDADFRQGIYVQHKVGHSPLLDLKHFNIVRQVFVGDKLHALDRGVTRRNLLGPVYGKWGAIKWPVETCSHISAQIKNITLPREIHRKFRGLDELLHWKGTEFSSFLLYASFLVMKKNLPIRTYEHFMLYFVAVTMLSSNVYKDTWDQASEMLKKYVEMYDTIYGEGYISSNVHNLLHLTDEVKEFGPLNVMSAYPFENALNHIKRMLRHGHKCLEQTINRLSEFESFAVPITKPNNEIFLKGAEENITLHIRGFSLNRTLRDGWFLSAEKEIIHFVFAEMVDSNLRIVGRKLLNPSAQFNSPCSSYTLYIFKGKETDLSQTFYEFKPSDVKAKMAAIRTEDQEETVFVPLLHTLI
ncbi:uncharacterized protein LOC128309240 [Anopheles moucheti]|uniref:uncharacterized protein LOC128309240 n=1 Tax=Anopheles moucheti TaxID=186751 RepID=UPI0022F0AFE7|nr:uncharacterized protein LOC128309240 [Anopheles moucheti]